MAHILNEAGFTQFGNNFINIIVGPHFNGLEKDILLILIRQTAGYHRASAPLPLSLICTAAKAKKQNVSRAVNDLIRRKVIIETECSYGRAARQLAVNGNTGEWDLGDCRADENKSAPAQESYPEAESEAVESSPVLPKGEKAHGSSQALPKAGVREPQRSSGRLPEGHRRHDPLNINKYKNNKADAAAVNNAACGSRLQVEKAAAAAAARPDTENQACRRESLLPLFLLVFGRKPNPIEIEVIEKELTENSALPWSTAFRIYEEGMRTVAISGDEQKTVRYLRGILKSEKAKALNKMEKEAAARQLHEAYQRGAETVWEPGTFLKMWEDSTGQKFYPDKGSG